MKIGSLARRAGVGVETIRFYERKRLIEQPPKPNEGGFRVYPNEAVQRIRFIRQAQGLGFSLKEIDELLSLRADPGADCADVQEQAVAKLGEVDFKIARLQEIRGALGALIEACPRRGPLGACSIMEALAGREDGEKPSRTIKTKERSA